MRLRLYESVIAFRFVFSRKIRGRATFDFCNTIGQERPWLNLAALYLRDSARLRTNDSSKILKAPGSKSRS
jgi:hypothetical protein